MDYNPDWRLFFSLKAKRSNWKLQIIQLEINYRSYLDDIFLDTPHVIFLIPCLNISVKDHDP